MSRPVNCPLPASEIWWARRCIRCAHSCTAISIRAASSARSCLGLIMTLTFTLGAGILIQDEGREAARELLIAALGCNVAWGFIDAAFYIIGQLFDRGRRERIAQGIRHAQTPAQAESLVAGELDGVLGNFTSDAERATLYRKIVEHTQAASPVPNRVTRADMAGAITSGLLVIAACVPAAILFLFSRTRDWRCACRTVSCSRYCSSRASGGHAIP